MQHYCKYNNVASIKYEFLVKLLQAVELQVEISSMVLQKVVLLLAKDYAKLILIAIVIAFPLAYWWMTSWLEDFAYQTSIGVGIFILGALIIAIVAFITVSFKSFKAATSNPVSALRDE